MRFEGEEATTIYRSAAEVDTDRDKHLVFCASDSSPASSSVAYGWKEGVTEALYGWKVKEVQRREGGTEGKPLLLPPGRRLRRSVYILAEGPRSRLF